MIPSIKLTVGQLLSDCLAWERAVRGRDIPPLYAEMHKAMIKVARYLRTGKLSNEA